MMRFGRKTDEPIEPISAGSSATLETRVQSLASVESLTADVAYMPPQQRDLTTATEAQIPQLRAQVLELLDVARIGTMSSEQLRTQIRAVVHGLADRERLQLSAKDQDRLAQELAADMVGYGPLEGLLEDERVTEVMINGPDKVFVEIAGKMTLTSVRFRDSQQLSVLAQKIASAVGRRIDEASPLVDCRLPDGSRVNIVFPPLALDGACVTIRKFSKRRMTLETMVANGSMTAPVARILELAARCRLNIVVSGGTGSGKTTLLNAMSQMIDHGERIVTIEDAAELQLQQPHVVRLETRPSNLEGKGEILQRDLLKNALRMRPDRIILGECRGPEAFDMLQAMNTGHDGSICTMHANTARDALTRIENMVQMGLSNLPVSAIRRQIVGALDIIVQIERMRDGQRRVTAVTEVCGLEGDTVTMNEVV
ncbi:MAG: CpaF family protein, partial [Acetobacteraceae bacterium]|nr:CpaF family protein [Acetobacteraceae bacterium]